MCHNQTQNYGDGSTRLIGREQEIDSNQFACELHVGLRHEERRADN